MTKRADIPDAQIIAACLAYRNHEAPTPDEALPYPPKVILAKMLLLSNRNLIDYGVSLRTAWPTKRGLALLDD